MKTKNNKLLPMVGKFYLFYKMSVPLSDLSLVVYYKKRFILTENRRLFL